MQLTPRRKLLVDPKVQIALLIRVTAYWCFYVLAVALLLLFINDINAPDGTFFSYLDLTEVFRAHGVVVLVGLAMLPIILWDVLALSNRLVGPVYRLRKSMRALSNGQPLQFRKGDFRPEMADEFNALLAHIEDLTEQLKRATKGKDDAPAEEHKLAAF